MPTYDIECGECGVVEDAYYPLAELDSMVCPDCEGTAVRRLVSPVPTHGIVFSNAVYNAQLGRTFESNAEVRAYQKEKGVEFVSTNSQHWRDTLDYTRSRVEKLAKRKGHKDFDGLKAANRKKKKARQSS